MTHTKIKCLWGHTSVGPLTEQDDIDCHIKFEKIMDAYKIIMVLLPGLTAYREAQQASAALPNDESSTHDGVKAAIL